MISCRVGIRLQRLEDGAWEARAKAAADGEVAEATRRGSGYARGVGATCAAAARAAVEDLQRLLLAKEEPQDPAQRRSSSSGRGARRSSSGRGGAPAGARRLSEGFRR